MSQIDAAFLSLLNHGAELLNELRRGDMRIEGPLKMRVDGFAAAHSQAMDVAKYAKAPSESVGNGGVFDGGPVSAGAPEPEAKPPTPALNVEEQHRADVQAGVDLATANKPLPDDASPSVRQGYQSIIPPAPDEQIQPFDSEGGEPVEG